MAEQATAGEQISRAAEDLRRNISGVTKAMAEQATAMQQISTASESMRVQADQAARAVKEQARTMREMAGAAESTAKQIKLITNANREHSTVSSSLVESLAEIRRIAERNASGVKQARGGTDDLVRRADAFASLVKAPTRRRGTNGRASRSNGA
jgi:methyl-accepting chemotaxis protein